MRWGMVVGGALILSLGVNIYLLMFDSIDSPGSTRRPTRQASRARAENAPQLPVPDQVARLDRAALETRLAKAEAKLEKILPVPLKFHRAEVSAESEARLQPILDKIFDGAEYTLECRAQICRIRSDSTDDWRDALQSNPDLQPDVQGMVTGRDYGEVFVPLHDDPRAAAIRTLVGPAYALRASTALTECKRNNPATGTLWLSLKIEARRFVVSSRGPLAEHAVGVCVRRALEDIAAATKIPSDVTSTEEVPFPVEVP